MSRWCLGLFASAVSRWCLHRLGMCSVLCGSKVVLCGSRWCLHRLGMCSVAPKIVFVFYVDSKGNVKQFFGLRFGRFAARV